MRKPSVPSGGAPRKAVAPRPKVAVMTFLEAKNHGAFLQAYALQRFLRELGVPNRLIDYSCPHLAWAYAPLRRGGLFKGSIADVLARLRLAVLDARRNRAFARFARRNFVRTRRYFTLTDLQGANAAFETFIAGSDQVFSIRCSNLDTAYFLSFVDDDAKKVSYAASFGFDTIPGAYRELYRALLAPFRSLSLREESGARIVRELLDGRASGPEVHVDPTLLLGQEAWRSVAAQSRRRAPRRYLFLYNVYRPERLFDEAFRLARERGLDVVYLGRDLPLRDRLRSGVRSIASAGPDDFVRFVRDAACVLTNSFHGTVFSILFHKPFLVELENRGAFNHRAAALLSRLSLTERALPSSASAEALDAPVDWDSVEEVLRAERDRSADYLRSVVART